MSESLYELNRKIRASKNDGTVAVGLALNELETLYLAEHENGRGKAFLKGQARWAIEAVANDLKLLTPAFLRWLPNGKLAALSNEICYLADIPNLDADTAVLFDLTGSDRRRAEAVALCLVSMATSPALSVGWLLSLVKEHGSADNTTKLVEELMDYHVKELPVSTRRLLMEDRNPLVQLEVARRALKPLDDRETYLQNLPDTHELDMPIPMHLMYSSLHYERNRSISEASEKNSIFASLVKARRFKYSTRTSIEIHHADGIQEQTLEMTPFSVSFELPVSERADPFGARVKRQIYRQRGTI